MILERIPKSFRTALVNFPSQQYIIKHTPVIISQSECIFVPNQGHGENRQKKASWTQGFEFLSVRKKVRPSAGKDQKFSRGEAADFS